MQLYSHVIIMSFSKNHQDMLTLLKGFSEEPSFCFEAKPA